MHFIFRRTALLFLALWILAAPGATRAAPASYAFDCSGFADLMRSASCNGKVILGISGMGYVDRPVYTATVAPGETLSITVTSIRLSSAGSGWPACVTFDARTVDGSIRPQFCAATTKTVWVNTTTTTQTVPVHVNTFTALFSIYFKGTINVS